MQHYYPIYSQAYVYSLPLAFVLSFERAKKARWRAVIMPYIVLQKKSFQFAAAIIRHILYT